MGGFGGYLRGTKRLEVPPDWQQLMALAVIRPSAAAPDARGLQLAPTHTLYCFCCRGGHSADPLISRKKSLTPFFSKGGVGGGEEEVKRQGEEEEQWRRQKALVCVFIGS